MLNRASKDVAETLRVLLHTPGTWDVKQPEVTYLIARHNLRFKEIEAFVAQLRPRFEAEMERQKNASAEWATASELDREDLLAEFTEKAITSLGHNAETINLELLMTGELKHLEEDDTLLDRFAGDSALYSFYLGRLGNRVATVPSDDHFRASWEKLGPVNTNDHFSVTVQAWRSPKPSTNKLRAACQSRCVRPVRSVPHQRHHDR